MKKNIFGITVAILFALLLTACTGANVHIIGGKANGFDTFDEMDQLTPIIIKALKESEEESTVHRTDDGDVTLGYTVSKMKVTEVMKNSDSDENIKEGNVIPIMEHSFYDENKKTQISYNAYKKMNLNEEYLLFLLPEQDNLYAVQGAIFGKVPLNDSGIQLYQDKDSTEMEAWLDKFFQDARNKYLK